MGRCMWGIGKRLEGDSRITLFRYETDRYIYGKGWKMSVSLHPRVFYWGRWFRREFRLTLFGLNVHYRAA